MKTRKQLAARNAQLEAQLRTLRPETRAGLRAKVAAVMAENEALHAKVRAGEAEVGTWKERHAQVSEVLEALKVKPTPAAA